MPRSEANRLFFVFSGVVDGNSCFVICIHIICTYICCENTGAVYVKLLNTSPILSITS